MLVGLGMRTWADGRTLLLGSPSLLRRKVRVSKKASEWVGCAAKAETPLLLALDGTLVTDRPEVRPEAAQVLTKLRANRIVMLWRPRNRPDCRRRTGD